TVSWNVSQITTIDFNRTAVGIVKTTKQFEQRALAGAVWTDDGDDLAVRDRHGEIIQRRRGGIWICEGYVIENNCGFDVANGRPRRATHTDRLQGEKFEEVAEKKTVAIKLACIFQQRAHQTLALIEGRVNQRQLS